MKICISCEKECPCCGGKLIDKKKGNITDTIANVAGDVLDAFVAVDLVDTILDLIE